MIYYTKKVKLSSFSVNTSEHMLGDFGAIDS